MSVAEEKLISFECCSSEMLGVLHIPERVDFDVGILVVVGGPQYRVGSHRQFVLMARALAAAGFPVFRFDCRGMGDSGGESRGFDGIGDDIRAASDCFLASVAGLRRIVLWGLCDGASAILMSCAGSPHNAGLVLANPWVHSASGEAQAVLKQYYGARLLQRGFWIKVFSARFNLLKSVSDFVRAVFRARMQGGPVTGQSGGFVARMLEGLVAFNGPVLVLISGRDLTAQEFVGLCERNRHWQQAMSREGIEVYRMAEADHTFSTSASLEQASRRTVDWLQLEYPQVRK